MVGGNAMVDSAPLSSEQRYQAYLLRVQEKLGGAAAGAYAKYQGRLIKVLDLPEFVQHWSQYEHLHASYDQIMAGGDTVNDAIVQMLRERAAELLLDFEL